MEKFKAEWMTYGIVGEEVGDQGTPHLQGYIECKPPKRLSSLRRALEVAGLPSAHWTRANGSAVKNKKYCTKGDGRQEEWGQPTRQGQRTDLQDLQELAESGASFLKMAREMPQAHARHHGWARMVREAAMKERALKRIKTSLGDSLRPWQAEIMERLAVQTERKVMWVWEETGGLGKSWLGRYLAVHKGAYVCTGGKLVDIAYAFNEEEHVVLDLARDQVDTVPYRFLEGVKNGVLTSTKYKSQTKYFDPAKVVVFANFPPDRSKLSADRWDVRHIAVPAEEED